MRTRFITSAPDVEHCPDLDLPEIGLLGRSNTGKSSLLNRLANAKIARTSQTPGRTQLINLFEVKTAEATFVLADLPGYGYARAPKAIAKQLPKTVDGYLRGRSGLVALLLLIDVRRGVEAEEVVVCERIGRERPDVALWVVGTKVDKIPKAKRKPALHQIAAALDVPQRQVVPSSAKDGIGIDELRQTLVELVAPSAE